MTSREKQRELAFYRLKQADESLDDALSFSQAIGVTADKSYRNSDNILFLDFVQGRMRFRIQAER